MSRQPPLGDQEVEALAVRLFGVRTGITVAAVATPGMETRAFRVTDGRRTGCLRIGWDLRAFRKDAWARTTLGAVVPVPEVWDFGELPDGRAYCLTSWASGVTLQDLDRDALRRVIPAVFDTWSRLQMEPTDGTAGFGDLDPKTMIAPYPSHRARLLAELGPARLWPISWSRTRAGAVAMVLERYEALIDHCPDQRSFVHGDWGSNNLLVADDRVSAVLDWETAGIGDPLQDIAGRFWAFWPAVSACVSLQASYADRRLSVLPAYRQRVLCYDLRTGIDLITDCLAEGDTDFARRSLARCLELLEEYDRSPGR